MAKFFNNKLLLMAATSVSDRRVRESLSVNIEQQRMQNALPHC